MEVAAIAVLVIFIIAMLLKMRSGPKKQSHRSKPNKAKKKLVSARSRKPVVNHNYPAVSIKFGAEACQAAQDLEGQRFLADKTPTLPLGNCNCANCSCKYIHHAVRREQGEERRAPGSMQTNLYETTEKPERRKRRKRRSRDPG